MNDLRKATERGTKAWADVPDATEWVEELRGYDTPQVTPEVNEPEGWVKIDEVRQYFDSVGCGTIYKTAGEDRVPLYSAPYTKLDTTAGVLHKEWVGLSEDEFEKILETHNEAMPFAVYLSIEAKLKEKNT